MHSPRSQPSPPGREGPQQPRFCPAPAPSSSSQEHPSTGHLQLVGAQLTQVLLPGPCPHPGLYSCCSFISMSDTRMFFSVASLGPEELRL